MATSGTSFGMAVAKDNIIDDHLHIDDDFWCLRVSFFNNISFTLIDFMSTIGHALFGPDPSQGYVVLAHDGIRMIPFSSNVGIIQLQQLNAIWNGFDYLPVPSSRFLVSVKHPPPFMYSVSYS